MKKFLPRTKFFKSLSKKVMASGALIFDAKGRLLMLKTTYRDGWIIPGGISEDRESPTKTCLREVKEELGLKIKLGQLLCVDYKPPTLKNYSDDSVQFIFHGGSLTEKQIARITLNPDEHSEFAFVPRKAALELLHPALAERLPHCLAAIKTGRSVYLEHGKPVKF